MGVGHSGDQEIDQDDAGHGDEDDLDGDADAIDAVRGRREVLKAEVVESV